MVFTFRATIISRAGRTLGGTTLSGTVVASIVNNLEVTGTPTLLYRDGSLGDAKAIGQNLFRYFKSSAEVIRRAVTQDIR